MKMKEEEGIEGKTFVVTGGLGFVGSTLCFELIRKDENVKTALQGADCVFHIASFGNSGKEMLQTSRIDEVNIEGTGIILDVCLQFNIKRLVYVSTYNVVFGGKQIVNGDENLPYIPPHQHISPYARTKAVAEHLVLSYNATPFRENGGCLYTCAVRPGAVYGAGEGRTFPRIINYAKLRLLLFKVGDSNVKTDWIYVDNLVHGLLLASVGLLHEFPDKQKRRYVVI